MSLFRDPYHAFGWSGLIPTYHYSSNAVCRKPTRVVAIEGRPLAHLIERDPLMGFIVMRRIAEMISARLRENRLALLKTA